METRLNSQISVSFEQALNFASYHLGTVPQLNICLYTVISWTLSLLKVMFYSILFPISFLKLHTLENLLYGVLCAFISPHNSLVMCSGFL